jgi:hypothetical protein
VLEHAYFLDNQPLSLLDSGRREGSIQHVFSFLGFLVRDETEGRTVLVKAVVETPFLVPPVLVVVDVLVGLGVCKVELYVFASILSKIG